jgi:3-methyladenine DNA glycosylase AlkD
MTVVEVMAELEAKGNEKWRKMNAKNGAGDNQFGVMMGDIRALAKKIKINHELGLELWQTGNIDAMILAPFVMRPKDFNEGELNKMVSEATFTRVADSFNSNIVKNHPLKEELRQKWMKSTDTMCHRAGWSLTTERVIKSPEGLDLVALLDRVENEMGLAPESLQWMMNYCLAEIGIHFAEHRERAIALGEKIGAFRDFPTSKGCTSPFAPIWINAMVSRQS